MNRKYLKRYVVTEEIIDGEPSKCYTIRVNTDVSPSRFKILNSFDTFEEADKFIRGIRFLQEYRGVV